jgi:hypothetical protein
VIAFFFFQYAFWTMFLLPTQGFFNALIYFYSPMQKPRQRATEPTHACSSGFTDATPPLRRFSFPLRRSTASADPVVAFVEHVLQEEELQDSGDEDPDVDQIDRNGATGGSWIGSDPVGMELSTISEANPDH